MIACEWGLAGIKAWRESAAVFVIVDVLSFSTTVSVAVDRGATILPFGWGADAAATVEAERRSAIVASPRDAGGGRVSLSPASMRRVDRGARILLPSPNGALLSLSTGGVPTISGCLRNADAVARSADDAAGTGTIVVVAAGERWPDGTLRPALEDWIGAGAIIRRSRAVRNADAQLAVEGYLAVEPRLPELLRDCRSGRELIGRGFAEDVEVALEFNGSAVVPVLRDGAYGVHRY